MGPVIKVGREVMGVMRGQEITRSAVLGTPMPQRHEVGPASIEQSGAAKADQRKATMRRRLPVLPMRPARVTCNKRGLEEQAPQKRCGACFHCTIVTVAAELSDVSTRAYSSCMDRSRGSRSSPVIIVAIAGPKAEAATETSVMVEVATRRANR